MCAVYLLEKKALSILKNTCSDSQSLTRSKDVATCMMCIQCNKIFYLAYSQINITTVEIIK